MDYTPIYHDIFYSQTYNVSVDSLGRLDCQQFFGIVEDLKEVNMFITAKKYKEAINLLDINIALLGNHYLSPTMDVSDDTGTKLILGKIEQENGCVFKTKCPRE